MAAVEIDANIASLAAFKELHMRIIRQKTGEHCIIWRRRGYRGTDQLGRDGRAFGIVEIELEIIGPKAMAVPNDHHRVGNLAFVDVVKQPATASGITVPI